MSEVKEITQLCRILEGALFAEQKPLSMNNLLDLFDENERPDRNVLRQVLEKLQQDYEDRGVELKELASGFQFQVRADLSKWMSKLWEEKAPRYSRALLETLVLIAYRQPITRGEIEEIRGVVVSSNLVRTLMDREWIKVVGHKDVPGKPALLATTKEFLDYFGLKKLENLPPLSEIQDLDKVGEVLAEQLQLEETQTQDAETERAETTDEQGSTEATQVTSEGMDEAEIETTETQTDEMSECDEIRM